jgi:lauroyl/myristoyl acyltransferase
MIDGRSDAKAIEIVEQIEEGAGTRARRLIDTLGSAGTMTSVPPSPADPRWRIRHAAALITGAVLSLLGMLLLLAPTWFLVSIFDVLPSTPVVDRVWRSRRARILDNLKACGYSDQPQHWLLRVGRRCAASTPANYLFSYLSVSLSRRRLDRLVDRLFDRDSADDIAGRLHEAGATVAVFLHSPLCAAVPNALRLRGLDVVRTIAGRWHGMNISESSGGLSDFFGESTEMNVDIIDPLATGVLVRHLRAGSSIHIALDRAAADRRGATIEMIGQGFSRNDGPAWLAVRSGRPLALLTTHRAPSGIVITASPLIHPDPSLPAERRVAAVSERLYAYAEGAIRKHPEAWACWSYLSEVTGTAITPDKRPGTEA